ncbi:MAG: hypothetical protein ACTHLE_00255 [Agriterribacter sp.]
MASNAHDTHEKINWLTPLVWGIVSFVLFLYIFVSFGVFDDHHAKKAEHGTEQTEHHNAH